MSHISTGILHCLVCIKTLFRWKKSQNQKTTACTSYENSFRWGCKYLQQTVTTERILKGFRLNVEMYVNTVTFKLLFYIWQQAQCNQYANIYHGPYTPKQQLTKPIIWWRNGRSFRGLRSRGYLVLTMR